MECRQSAAGMERKFQVVGMELKFPVKSIHSTFIKNESVCQTAKAPRRQGLFSLTPTFGLHAGRSREVKTGSDHRVCTTTGAKAPRRQGLFSLAPTFDVTHAGDSWGVTYVNL